jgi:hypothetical protein
MAYDDDEGYYHFVRDGWVRCDCLPFPEGRIITWRFTMRQSYVTQPCRYELYLEWAHPHEASIDSVELVARYGLPIQSTASSLVRLRTVDKARIC